jgi:hypothetical protein
MRLVRTVVVCSKVILVGREFDNTMKGEEEGDGDRRTESEFFKRLAIRLWEEEVDEDDLAER